MHADVVTDPLCHHGEGPHWSSAWGDGGALRWVDMLAGRFLEWDLVSGAPRSVDVPGPVVACVRPRRGGGAVLALEKGFGLEGPDGTIRALEALWEGPVRMNEGAVMPDGSFCCGTMAYDQAPGAASMHRLMPDLAAREVATGLTISNGLALSPDRALAYYVDTPTGRVDVLDWDDERGLVNRRAFADLGDEEGSPDGLTVDALGNVWVAMFGGGSVLGLDALGNVVERIGVGARQVTACAFGGEDLSALCITTSREGLADDEDPQAGSLFAAVPGVRGIADEIPFTG